MSDDLPIPKIVLSELAGAFRASVRKTWRTSPLRPPPASLARDVVRFADAFERAFAAEDARWFALLDKLSTGNTAWRRENVPGRWRASTVASFLASFLCPAPAPGRLEFAWYFVRRNQRKGWWTVEILILARLV